MNLIHRLVQQAQESPAQLRPRSSLSVYENAPLLEPTVYSEHGDTQEASTDNIGHEQPPWQPGNILTTAEANSGNEFSAAALNLANGVEEEIKQQTGHSLTVEESEVNDIVPLMSQQKNSQSTTKTQKRPVSSNKTLPQHDDKMTISSKKEKPIIPERNNTVANFTHSEDLQNVQQNTESALNFKPLMENKKRDNQSSGLAIVSDKTTPVYESVPATPVYESAPAPIEVHVSIGRIEVKAQREPSQPVKAVKSKTKAPMSLAAYLAEREEGRR